MFFTPHTVQIFIFYLPVKKHILNVQESESWIWILGKFGEGGLCTICLRDEEVFNKFYKVPLNVQYRRAFPKRRECTQKASEDLDNVSDFLCYGHILKLYYQNVHCRDRDRAVLKFYQILPTVIMVLVNKKFYSVKQFQCQRQFLFITARSRQ